MSDLETVLEARGITRKFDNLAANDNVDFQLRRREIHALLGENGAGKTTLCNIFYGFLKPNAGTILLHGKPVKLDSPKDAMRAGIGMVHQELMLIPNMTVTENVGLTMDYDVRKPTLNLGEVDEKLKEMQEVYGLAVDPNAVVEHLSVGEKQRVEILKCLFRGVDILIFDEPTAYLTAIETEKLFTSLRRMVNEGKSVIFVTHKIDEILEVADRITVLRQGKVVAVRDKSGLKKEELARLIVGRDVVFRVQKVKTELGPPVLELTNVTAISDFGVPGISDVCLGVRKGEILGIAAVTGNGQKELVEVITGLRKVVSGRISLDGEDITNDPPSKTRSSGVAHIPEEQRLGLVYDFDMRENILMSPFLAENFKKGMFVDVQKLDKKLSELIDDFCILTPSKDALIWTLSGGNKQRFTVARELFWDPKVIIANNPTKGLDVASTEHVRNLLMKEKARQKAILLISTDLDEILDMSDRVAVLNRGRVMGVFDSEDADVHRIALLMTTTSTAEAPSPTPP